MVCDNALADADFESLPVDLEESVSDALVATGLLVTLLLDFLAMTVCQARLTIDFYKTQRRSVRISHRKFGLVIRILRPILANEEGASSIILTNFFQHRGYFGGMRYVKFVDSLVARRVGMQNMVCPCLVLELSAKLYWDQRAASAFQAVLHNLRSNSAECRLPVTCR